MESELQTVYNVQCSIIWLLWVPSVRLSTELWIPGPHWETSVHQTLCVHPTSKPSLRHWFFIALFNMELFMDMVINKRRSMKNTSGRAACNVIRQRASVCSSVTLRGKAPVSRTPFNDHALIWSQSRLSMMPSLPRLPAPEHISPPWVICPMDRPAMSGVDHIHTAISQSIELMHRLPSSRCAKLRPVLLASLF